MIVKSSVTTQHGIEGKVVGTHTHALLGLLTLGERKEGGGGGSVVVLWFKLSKDNPPARTSEEK